MYLNKFFKYDNNRYPHLFPKDINWMDIPQEIKDYIIGGLLGDLCIVKKTKNSARGRHSPRGAKPTPYLLFGVRTKNKSYIDSLFNLFQPMCNMTSINKNDEYLYSYTFNTLSYDFLNEIYNLFYVNKIKVIPYNIGGYLTPRAIAYWFQDDGNCNYLDNGVISSFNFATHCFTFADMHYLSYVLKVKFNLNITVNINKGKPILYVSAKSRKIFLDLVNPYIHNNF